MRLGIIGRGPWGDTYARTLRGMGIDYWQAGRDYEDTTPRPDGAIVASAPDSHRQVAEKMMFLGVPVLVEKPVTINAMAGREFLRSSKKRGAIVFTGHTRLYSPAWREFKRQALEEGVASVYAVAGGACKLDPWWDWGPHLVAMCLDLGFDPADATLITTRDEVPLHFDVNGGSLCFGDVPTTPTPLEVLISEFVAAIEAGKPDIRGLELGVKVVEYLEEAAAGHRASMATPA